MAQAYTQPTANTVRAVRLTQEEEGTPGSFPIVGSPCVYKAMPVTISYSPQEGAGVTFTETQDPDRAIYVAHIRSNTPILGAIYLVNQLAPGVYVIDNQMAFLQNQ